MLPGLVGTGFFATGVDGGSAVAPTFGAVGTHTAGSLTAAYPTGISADDLLLITVAQTAGDNTTTYTASGWTLLYAYQQLETSAVGWGGIHVLYKIATGSESGSVTVTRSGTAPNQNGAVMERYSGVDVSATPYEGITTKREAVAFPTPGTFTSSAITTTANGRLLINKYFSPTVISMTPGAGWTERWELNRTGIGPDYIFTSTTKDAVGFGAQSSEVCAPASSSEWWCLSFALKGTP